jgi:hypothetical protein
MQCHSRDRENHKKKIPFWYQKEMLFSRKNIFSICEAKRIFIEKKIFSKIENMSV